jgi:hypothetical protein
MTPQGLIDRKDHAGDLACGIWPRAIDPPQTASQG